MKQMKRRRERPWVAAPLSFSFLCCSSLSIHSTRQSEASVELDWKDKFYLWLCGLWAQSAIYRAKRSHSIHSHSLICLHWLAFFVEIERKRKEERWMNNKRKDNLINQWKRNENWVWLGSQHITNHSVIKEKIYLFFMKEASKPINLIPFHWLKEKE